MNTVFLVKSAGLLFYIEDLKLPLPVLMPDEEKKLSEIFKAFIKPSGASQRSENKNLT